jgi:hypothetical protein
MSDDKFFPGIKEYLEDNNFGININIPKDDLKKLSLQISAEIGLDKEISEEIVKQFFDTIKLKIIRGEKVILYELGSLYFKKYKKTKILKFKAMRNLLNKMNGKKNYVRKRRVEEII